MWRAFISPEKADPHPFISALLRPMCRLLPALGTAACLTPTDPVIVHSIVKGKVKEAAGEEKHFSPSCIAQLLRLIVNYVLIIS